MLIGIGTAIGQSAGAPLNASAAALIGAMTNKPAAQRQALINTFQTGLDTFGLRAKLDGLFVEASHDAQSAGLNWIDPSQSLSLVASPTFAVDRGYAGDGAASYVVMPVALSALTKYVSTSAHIGIYCNVAQGADTGRLDCGASDANAATLLRSYNTVSGDIAFQINTTAGVTSGTTVASELGHTIVCKNAGAQTAYKNGAALTTFGQGSTGVPAYPMFQGARNAAGTANGFTSRRYAVWHYGSNLTATDVTNLTNLVNTYLTALGANA